MTYIKSYNFIVFTLILKVFCFFFFVFACSHLLVNAYSYVLFQLKNCVFTFLPIQLYVSDYHIIILIKRFIILRSVVNWSLYNCLFILLLCCDFTKLCLPSHLHLNASYIASPYFQGVSNT